MAYLKALSGDQRFKKFFFRQRHVWRFSLNIFCEVMLPHTTVLNVQTYAG